jgi:hypothetical protein
VQHTTYSEHHFAFEDEASEEEATKEEATEEDDLEVALEIELPPVGNINVSEDAPTNPFADDVHVEDDSSNNDVLGELPSGGDASVDNDPYHKMLVESAIDYSFADRLATSRVGVQLP